MKRLGAFLIGCWCLYVLVYCFAHLSGGAVVVAICATAVGSALIYYAATGRWLGA